MTKKQAEQVDAPVVSPLLDAYGNPSLVSADELIESAWGNSVASRVTYRFPDKATMDAFAAPVGTLAYTTNLNVFWTRDVSSWRPTAIANRVSFRVIGGGAGQPIPANTITTCQFQTEWSDPFNTFAGGVFTVPAGWGGRYMFEYSVAMAVGDSGQRQTWLQMSTTRYAMDHRPSVAGGGGTWHLGAASIVMAAGDQASVSAYLTSDSDIVMNSSTDQYFQGYYVGPY